MGLVFRDQEERATETYENVGSRDWMPPWGMGIRLDDVKPTFDVFSLGKLLWFMISGKSVLQLWYYEKPQFNLERQFPNDPRMRWANRLLAGCICEEPDHCWQSARELQNQVDEVLDILRKRGEVLGASVKRYCRVCGRGQYKMIVNEKMSPGAVRNFGLNPVGDPGWRIFSCSYCGHVEMFRLEEADPSAWAD
jgi:hypothetical protein